MDTTGISEATEDSTDEPRIKAMASSGPDTALFLTAGARYGFGFLDDRPTLLWNPRLALGGFTWQKWTAFRYRTDASLPGTLDFDSLATLLISGPLPGFLTADPRYPGEPSLPVMGAVLQNLVELCLGVRVEATSDRVTIQPRLPGSWGHTTARVPFEGGYLNLDFDFAKNLAYVGTTGIDATVQVFFGFPLPEGGFTSTQFVVNANSHPQRIELIHDRENRLDLRVEEVP
jgi:hypothetical protein